MKNLAFLFCKFSHELSVATFTEEKLVNSITCLSCSLLYQSVSYSVDLKCSLISCLVIILGTHWLHLNRVVICGSDKPFAMRNISIDSNLPNLNYVVACYMLS